MKPDVREVSLKTVLQYLILNYEVSEEPWVESVMDTRTVKLMLSNGSYAKQRKAHGLFLGETMIGYAVIHVPSETLDLLHVAEDFRGSGYSTAFLKELAVSNVVVDSRNIRAINLYTKLGYELEFFED